VLAPEGDVADDHAADRAAVRGADDERVGPLAFRHPVRRARRRRVADHVGPRRGSHVGELAVQGHPTGLAFLLDRRRAGQRGTVPMREHANRDEFATTRVGEQPGQAQRVTAALAAVDAHDDRVEHGIWECHESSVGAGLATVDGSGRAFRSSRAPDAGGRRPPRRAGGQGECAGWSWERYATPPGRSGARSPATSMPTM
jgi:hypothetical protein